jgi:peptide chain release factor 2
VKVEICGGARKRSAKGYFNFETVFDLPQKLDRIHELESRMSDPAFWNNQTTAQTLVGELKQLKNTALPLKEAIAASADLEGLLEMSKEEPSMKEEVAAEIRRLEKIADEIELQSLLRGPHDSCDAILSIHARDGGVDANDWADMVLRMYANWASHHEYKIELLDRQDNEEAGITQATIAVRGPMAYGYLKGEEGMHRLVRISPFNAEGKRQTSFAAVDVSPELDDSIVIDIQDKDIREDTFRASGAGGQHVNKTDSAIRLTHLPTGTVVQCQAERSQHKNRATAYKMLKARLARIEEVKREAEQAEKYKNKARVGFGSQIRNYFLHPDQRVKDARTGFQVGSFHAVMDGEIQGFLDAYLRWSVQTDAQVAGE